MKSRKKKSLPKHAKRYQQKRNNKGFSYENLEPRKLLATDMLSSVINVQNENGSDLIVLEEPTPLAQADEVLRNQLELGENESVVLKKVQFDQIGWQRLTYQQYLDGIPVEGSQYKLHVLDGDIRMMTGDRIKIDNPIYGTQITPEEGLQSAMSHLGQNAQFAWEVGGFFDTEAPEAETVYLTNIDGKSVVAYKYQIRTYAPFANNDVYVNAQTGDVEVVKSKIRNFDAPAEGLSVYDGNVNFTADNAGVNWILRQFGPNPFTIDTWTLDADGEDYPAPDAELIESDTNVFDNREGVSAHWASEHSLDYYRTVHGQNSYDGNGATLFNVVNLSVGGAFWDGTAIWYSVPSGGNGVFTAIDVTAHEMTHGVIENTSNLIYENESGALNESFSDIFGERVDSWESGGGHDWIVGGEVIVNGQFGIRSFINPNSRDQPDTYMGDLWFTGPGDNGGVHFNSGVQNKWFHLLSEGATNYFNDNGERYSFPGIGMDDAADIAYLNMTQMLSPFSNYQDARDGAVRAAIDLFGVGSQQHLSTIKAWRAVGVYGTEIIMEDVSAVIPGSLIYSQSYTGTNSLEPTVIFTNFESDQDLSVVVAPLGASDVDPWLRVQQPSGTTDTFFEVDRAVVANGVFLDSAGEHVLIADGFAGSVGAYSIDIYLNADLESEAYDDVSNGTMATAVNIDSSAYDLGTNGSSRLGVVGNFSENEVIPVAEDGFETAAFSGDWDLNSTDDLGLGRIRATMDAGAAIGTYAMIMDTLGVENNLNEAVWTVDLSTTDDPYLFFYHAEWDDENTALPDVFSNSRNGDGVSVSEDGVIWHTILTDTETAAGQWNRFGINLGEFADTVGINLNSAFKIKFQQYDDGEVLMGDGRGFDDIRIVPSDPVEDWYSFTLDAGQQAHVAVGEGIDADLELYDTAGNLIDAGQLQTNDTVGTDFEAAAAGTYYARVSGLGIFDYALVVTRGADFNTGSSPTANQDISGSVLGSVSAVTDEIAEPDDFGSLIALDNLFDGVTISNGSTGGSVYSVPTSFAAPTGQRVFGVDVTDEAGWQEAVNEFRADFNINQFNVSIDIGSDDGADDRGFLRAFDVNDNLLDEIFSGSLAPGEKETISVFDPEGEIAYVTAGGVGPDQAALDNLQFEKFEAAEDYYKLNVAVGQTVIMNASFPGEARFLFPNRLKTPGGTVNLRMELSDVNGNILATGEDTLTYFAETGGEFVLRVYADAGRGDYFVDITEIDGQIQNIGDTGLGIAVGDSETGLGYILFSEENVHDRFMAEPPFAGNADHFIAVRFDAATSMWQYNNNGSTWHDFTPVDGDRLVAVVDMTNDKIGALQGAVGIVEGILQGYDDSDMVFKANRWDGMKNKGEFEVTGTFFQERDNKLNVGPTNNGVAVADLATGTGYLMYSHEDVFTRFASSQPETGNANHLIAVRFHDGNWEYNDNHNWFTFTPAVNDQLLAELDFDANTVKSTQGRAEVVEGIGLGYMLSDLVFTENRWAGLGNLAEIGVEGTFFTVASQAYGDLGNAGNGVAVDDAATGTGYLMYSQHPVHARFLANQPWAGSANHVIAVRYIGGNWEYNDNSTTWHVFTPEAGDRLLAQVDFDADTVTSLQGSISVIHGIDVGYAGGDLTFTANRWAGANNRGEFEVAGTHFTISSDVYGIVGDVGDGIAVDDAATGSGFIMYSNEAFNTRFAANPPWIGNAARLIAVRWDAGSASWQYNDNTTSWYSFTPMVGDRLLAELDFDADTVTSLQGMDSTLNGIGLGYSTGDLIFTADRWAGVNNNGEFEVTGTFFEV